MNGLLCESVLIAWASLLLKLILTKASFILIYFCIQIVLFLFPGYLQRGERGRKNWGYWTR